MADNKFKFGELKEKVVQLKRNLPIELANDAQNYFVDAFDKQGFDGQPWKDVKRHDQTTPEYKYPIGLRARKLSSPILVGVAKGRSGGALRRAVGRSIKKATFETILLQVALPYARAQFFGTDTIPARPNMKQSKELGKQQKQKIKTFMGNLWGK